jgi:hypothetical protein
MHELPQELSRMIDPGLWHDCTDAQRQTVLDAYAHDSLIFERKIGTVMQAENPTARLVWQSRRILSGPARSDAPSTVRHDLDHPRCNDCGDSGFVELIRDVSDTALAGDAAPCHCALGITKQRRYGTVHYGADDYAPAIYDTPRISALDYARTDAGKADPHMTPPMLDKLRKVWRDTRKEAS